MRFRVASAQLDENMRAVRLMSARGASGALVSEVSVEALGGKRSGPGNLLDVTFLVGHVVDVEGTALVAVDPPSRPGDPN